jgi:hypothetical protein
MALFESTHHLRYLNLFDTIYNYWNNIRIQLKGFLCNCYGASLRGDVFKRAICGNVKIQILQNPKQFQMSNKKSKKNTILTFEF